MANSLVQQAREKGLLTRPVTRSRTAPTLRDLIDEERGLRDKWINSGLGQQERDAMMEARDRVKQRIRDDMGLTAEELSHYTRS